jgi:hypothetical protein
MHGRGAEEPAHYPQAAVVSDAAVVGAHRGSVAAMRAPLAAAAAAGGGGCRGGCWTDEREAATAVAGRGRRDKAMEAATEVVGRADRALVMAAAAVSGALDDAVATSRADVPGGGGGDVGVESSSEERTRTW